jgi:tRNA pseudouridine55 synthase
MNGVLVVDKPRGMTSAAVVSLVRRRARVASAGHTGTLDPLATGVLPVCVGSATKLSQWLTAEDKAYEAELTLGLETDTLDIDGVETRRDPDAAARVDRAALAAALAAVAAEPMQVPPMFSAIKQDGVRLHRLARTGVEVERAPRPVRIDRCELLDATLPRARIAIACSKGTYVRSLVRDVGTRLGCGAVLTALRRTASGRFTLADAVPLADITSPAAAAAHLISPVVALGLPTMTVPADRVRDVLDGRPLEPALTAGVGEGMFLILTEAGDVLAICELAAGALRYHRVLARPGSNRERSR